MHYMKHLTFILYIVVLALFSACNDDVFVTDTDMEELQLNVGLDAEPNTRGDMPAILGFDKRYILEVWEKTGTNTWTFRQRYLQTTAVAGANSFTLRLPKNTDYDIVVWVDYVTQSTTADLCYNTNTNGEGLSYVSIKNPGTTAAPQTLPYPQDAFTATVSWSVAKVNNTITAKRPLAQLNIRASDADEWKNIFNFSADPIKMRAYMKSIAVEFNAITGAAGARSTPDFNWTYDAYPAFIGGKYEFNYTSGAVYYSCLVFANDRDPADKYAVTFSRSIGTHVQDKKDYTVPDLLPDIDMTNIPLRRNYSTNVTCDLILGDVTFNVTVESGFYNAAGPFITFP